MATSSSRVQLRLLNSSRQLHRQVFEAETKLQHLLATLLRWERWEEDLRLQEKRGRERSVLELSVDQEEEEQFQFQALFRESTSTVDVLSHLQVTTSYLFLVTLVSDTIPRTDLPTLNKSLNLGDRLPFPLKLTEDQ
jgi:hypothetical protein